MDWKLDLVEPSSRAEVAYPARNYRRSWTHSELLGILPTDPVRALDLGAGRHPLQLRPTDEVVTADFDKSAQPTVVLDLTRDWPFDEVSFDLIYMSHVLEHFYPPDRDAVIRNVWRSLREGGLVFIRVPHRSSFQATGFEHFSFYGLNGATSLCHGYNPTLPMFRAVSVGVATSLDFTRRRSIFVSTCEVILNRWWRLTDSWLAPAVGGLPEVQFLLQRLPRTVESRIRADHGTLSVN